MSNFGPKEIKEIRAITGAGMLDVKKALDQANGNKDNAIKIIRLKGQKNIAKRMDRETSNGLVIAKIVDNSGYIFVLNSETDFVAKSEVFIKSAELLLDDIVKNNISNINDLLKIDSVKAKIDELQQKTGEKIVAKTVAKISAKHISKYMHKTNADLPPQVGVLVGLDTDKSADETEKIGHEIAMHIAAYSPEYLSILDVPSDIANEEKSVARDIAIKEGKPAQAIEKIVEGRFNGYLKEHVLLEQPYGRDNKKSIKQILPDGITITDFIKVAV
jgi:elongation factor Ts